MALMNTQLHCTPKFPAQEVHVLRLIVAFFILGQPVHQSLPDRESADDYCIHSLCTTVLSSGLGLGLLGAQDIY